MFTLGNFSVFTSGKGSVDLDASNPNTVSMAPAIRQVLCPRCQRIMPVLVTDCAQPRFQSVNQQDMCAEIQERKIRGEPITELMICQAIGLSLERELETNKVGVVLHDGNWYVVRGKPREASRLYTPEEARRVAKTWDGRDEATLASDLLRAADWAEFKQLGGGSDLGKRKGWSSVTYLIGFLAVCGGAWYFLTGGFPIWTVSPHSPVLIKVVSEQAARREPPPISSAEAPGAVASQIPTQQQAAAPPSSTPPGPRIVQPKSSSAETVSSSTLPVAMATPVQEPPATPVTVEMTSLAGGTFVMGSNEDPSEKPIRQVAIKPFAISKFPITVHQWNVCVVAKACPDVPMGEDDAPATNLSWNDAQQFVAWLGQTTHRSFRLPSEAEWEYAARGRTDTKYWWGNQFQIGMANCKGCNDIYDPARPMKVGSFNPNPFGLYDMGGGVDQWVQDCWHANYRNAPGDGSAWIERSCTAHVIRSGSWRNGPDDVRSASRDRYDTGVRYPTLGFRVAVSL